MENGIVKVAILWDKSFLWGLIAYRTFAELNINFSLVTSEDVRGGSLADCNVIFVPGGWASDKIVTLGEEGIEAIREFVAGGGSYLGFCGGAGLALDHENGLSLTTFGRMPTSRRLPSFSGRISLSHDSPDHPLWEGVNDGAGFYAWWPGQFNIDDGAEAEVLASYGEPEDGSFVTDLPVTPEADWERWEANYGINLDPEIIIGEPAVIEVRHGLGRVLLSYLHFETPGHPAGHRVLLNALTYLCAGAPVTFKEPARGSGFAEAPSGKQQHPALMTAEELDKGMGGLINFGRRNFLWYWRNEWLLQWRRGVRGIEYSTLFGMLRQIHHSVAALDHADNELESKLSELRDLFFPFIEKARNLLAEERYAMSQGPIGPLKIDNEEIQGMREELFSHKKRCGGMYEEIVNLADEILLPLLKNNRS